MQTTSFSKHCIALILSLAGASSTLTGCTSGPYPVTSPYYWIPTGSRIEVKQPLTIPPNTSRVYLQYGKVVSPKEKDRYQPNCWFLSWKLQESNQTIQPDTFIVKSIQKSQDVVQNLSNVMFASSSAQIEAGVGLGIGVGIGVGTGGNRGVYAGEAPLAVEYTTTLHIHSDKQPDIRQLACSHWDDPSGGEHLTVEKMQQALGTIALIAID